MNLEVRNLTKVFGSLRANDGISLRFAGGQIHGVLGENGAGKSTLMKLLSGLLKRDGGEILIDGKPVAIERPAEALAAGIGMVHQEPLDVPAFSALENLVCASPRWALPTRTEARNTLTVLAGRFGFTVEPDMHVAQMTMGQRQQLEIIRLLACGARALILDEPTTGITAAQARALFAALRKLAQDGNTVLFVSHKLDEVAALCDTVSVLRAGRAVGAQLPMPVAKSRMLELMFGATVDAISHPTKAAPTEVLTPTPPTWALDRVSVRDDNLFLRNMTLDLQPRSITGLAGLDGSGQQSLLRLLSGRLRPVAGQMRVQGKPGVWQSQQLLRAGIHYLPADRLNEGMIGALSLTEHFALQDGTGLLVDRAAARQAARQAIEEYAIKATPSTPIAALSGGNQQRAMLALLPEVCAGLLIEQPTRGLDVASARLIWERLLARCQAGAALVFASADLDELLDYSDQIVVFFGGRLSPPIPRAELSAARLAELIGGVGFEELT